MIEAIVTKSTGSWYKVQLEDGTEWNCRITGKHKLFGKQLTNPVAVGDRVRLLQEGSKNQGTINEILPRKNYIVRQSPRQKHQLHLLAANIDQACVISTIVQPNLKQGFVDRFLMMTEPYDIPVLIVFNKSDLFGNEELEMYAELKNMYEKIGYKVIKTSTINGDNIETLKTLLSNKITLITGQSGVGKTSLLMKLEPRLKLSVDEISTSSGKGQHTTTFAQMYRTSFGANIIDTPGIKSLSFSHFEPQDLAHNFREIFEYSKGCKFSNCMHRNEPNCNVKHALEMGEIHPLRYQNYLQLLQELEDQNYWERHTNY